MPGCAVTREAKIYQCGNPQCLNPRWQARALTKSPDNCNAGCKRKCVGVERVLNKNQAIEIRGLQISEDLRGRAGNGKQIELRSLLELKRIRVPDECRYR